MSSINSIRGRDNSVAAAVAPAADDEFTEPKSLHASDSSELDVAGQYEKEVEEHPDEPTKDALPGVKKIEAAAIVWDKPALYATYGWIWVCYFMLALQSSIGNNVINNAYSNFETAPAIYTAYILANIIGGVIKLPIAKMLSIWGRVEGFLVFVVVYLLGIIVIASCNGPSGFAAGYVLYWVGYDAIYLILDVFLADTTGLKNRAFSFGFVSTPFICTAFTGPLAAQSFIKTSSWRWAYGAFAIIMPVVFAPLALVFYYYQKKALKVGILKREESNRTVLQSTIYYLHEVDVVGALLLMAAFVLFLLPFSLVSYGRAEYKSAAFIVMVIIGVLLFPVFAIWEKYFARVHFVRWELFRERTVVGACCLAAILYYSFYAWDNGFYSFVAVVYNLDTAMTGYMTQIYNVGSCFWSVVFGLWVRYTKHFKYTCLFFGLPLMFLGAGLMIHFRGQDGSLNYIIMCQIFIAFSGGTLVIGEDMAVMASADRDGIPMMLSLIYLSSSVGGAIGYAVAASIYSKTFPDALRSALPSDEQNMLETIYLGGYLTQLTYPVGSATRDAINYAWGYSQRYNSISATCILVLAIPSIAVWKNYNVDKKQNKGVFI
ncbi:putative siderochrome-iron protein [Dipodascopsis uninucleata]